MTIMFSTYSKILTLVLTAFLGIFMIMPSFTFAQRATLSDPIVFCGTKASPTPCGVCDLFKLVKNLLDIAFFEVVPLIATMAIVYAGLLLLFSGSPFGSGSANEASNIFQGTLIGLLTAYSAWLIVNTIVVFFASQVTLGGVSFKDNWYRFSCKVDASGVINAGEVVVTGNGDGSDDEGNHSNSTGNSKYNTADKWCKESGRSASQAQAMTDSNKVILKEYVPVKSLVAGFQCQSSPFGAGNCAMSRAAADRLADLITQIKSVCQANSTNCSLIVTSAVRNSASLDPCHKQGTSQAGTCADMQIACSGLDQVKCLNIFREGLKKSQAVDALNEYTGTIPQGCPVPSTRTGNNVHVNF